jgi:hypothetical protein
MISRRPVSWTALRDDDGLARHAARIADLKRRDLLVEQPAIRDTSLFGLRSPRLSTS